MTNRIRYTRRFSRKWNITHNTYNPTPGEVLYKELMEPLGLTMDNVAAASGINRKKLQQMIYGQRRNSDEFSYFHWSMENMLRIAHMFDTTIDMWIDIDVKHRIYMYRSENYPADLYNIKQVKKSVLMKLNTWVKDQRRTKSFLAGKEATARKKAAAENHQQQTLNL